jgi:hypothetical protein
MKAPDIDHSTRAERERFVIEEFRCKADCDLCGACQFLRGRPAEELYADYIDGLRSFMDVTREANQM